jgi:NADPH2:quinone reductase
MKAIQLSKTGGPEVLELVELERPTVGPDQVLVRVQSASINFADIMRRRADPYPTPTPLPAVLGSEVAGIIEAVGSDVKGLMVGDLVFSMLPEGLGGYAQFAVAESSDVIKLPEDLDPDVACTLVVAGVTAYLILKEVARIGKDETVFIPAAAGGVGSYAVQLAKILGVKTVIAGAGSKERRELALKNGADHAVDYTTPGWTGEVRELTGGRGADVILEMIGGDFFNQSLDILAPFGRVVVFGAAAGELSTLVPQQLLGTNVSVIGFYVGLWLAHRPVESRAAFDALVGLIQSGQLKVDVSEKFPLERAAEAHKLIEARKVAGKAILKPWA